MSKANEERDKEVALVEPDSKYRALINVNSFLDDYGLDPYEFRVYGHVSRRAGKYGECFSRVERMADVCKISVRKVRYTLKFLCEAGLLREQKRPNKTTVYHLTPSKDWVDRSELDEIRQRMKKRT